MQSLDPQRIRGLRRLDVHEDVAAPHPGGEQEAVTGPGCLRIPLEHYPGMNRFVLDWMRGDSRFLSRNAPPRAAAVHRSRGLADALTASNRQWGLFVGEE